VDGVGWILCLDERILPRIFSFLIVVFECAGQVQALRVVNEVIALHWFWEILVRIAGRVPAGFGGRLLIFFSGRSSLALRSLRQNDFGSIPFGTSPAVSRCCRA
jgi:hypothetical protein